MDPTTYRYRIRLARADEVPRLRAIEDEAGTLFEGLGLIDEALDPSFPIDAAAKLVALRQVWVGCLESDLAVGMVIVSERDGVAYVEELDVVPAHGRRGLGARLLEQACAWAEARGYPAITLSTFRDVPWNGPFYRKHGFRDLEPAEWSAGMNAIREHESRKGLRVDARTFMRRELPSRAAGKNAGESGMRHHVRIAHPVSDLSRSTAMYSEGLGLEVLGSFEDHEGFDGVMLGNVGAAHHLELTSCRTRSVAPQPTEEDLLVFYMPDDDEWRRCCAAMRAAGFHQVDSFNPYWNHSGCTFQDPDGYRIVLQRGPWTSSAKGFPCAS